MDLPSRRRLRAALLTGLAIVAAATFALTAALLRASAVVLDGEQAYVWIAAGTGVGAIAAIVTRFARRPIDESRVLARATHGAMVAALAVVVVAIALVHVGTAAAAPAGAPSRLALATVMLFTCVAFAITGATSAVALSLLWRELETCCFTLFGGCALGALGSVLLLRAGAARALLVVAALFAFACAAFAIAAWSAGRAEPRRPRPATVATCLLVTSVLLIGDLGAPWLKLRTRGAGPDDSAELVSWSALTFLRVDKPTGGSSWIREDGEKAGNVYEAKQTAPTELEDIGLALHPEAGPTLVLDAGGGRGVRAASRAGRTDVDAIVLNPDLAQALLRGELAAWSGNVYAAPGVHLSVDDGRNFLRRTNKRYQLIVLAPYRAPAETVLANPALDASRFAEAGLFTEEAFTSYLRHLTDDGTLVVRQPVDRADEMRVLATRALAAEELAQPERHLFGCTHGGAAALVIQRAVLDAAGVAQLRRFCKTNKYAELHPSDGADARRRRARASAGDGHADDRPATSAAPTAAPAPAPGASATPAASAEASLPSDDRPFAVQSARSAGVTALLRNARDIAADPAERVAVLIALGLALLFVVSLAAPALMLRARDAEPPRRWAARVRTPRALVALASIGGALSWAGTALVRLLVGFLGHPVFALSVVIPVVLISLGGGCLVARRLEPFDSFGLATRGVLACALGIGLAFGLSPILASMTMMALLARVACAVAISALFGLVVGALLPSGLGAVAPDDLGWGWGMFGIGSGFGLALGALIAAHAGFSILILGAALLLGLCVVLLPERPRRSDGNGRDIDGANAVG